MIRFSALALTLALVLPTVVGSLALAETVEFTDTVRVVMGSRESQDEVRVYATQEAKRRVLDRVGVYLSGSTEIVRKVQESFGSVGQVSNLSSKKDGLKTHPTDSFTDTTSVLQRIQTLTVGVVQTEVVSEEWKTEGGAVVLYLVCRVKVDPEDALNRLTELLKDKEKVEDYQKVQEEVARLRTELEQLRSDLANAKSEQETKAVKEEVQTAINGLTAAEWYKKGKEATEPDDKIACYSLSIQLNPNWSWPYFGRGQSHYGNNNYDRAIEDISLGLAITPNEIYPYIIRGNAYHEKRDFYRAMDDYSAALKLDSCNALAYKLRGESFISVQDYNRAVVDMSSAIQIDPTMPSAYSGRGLALAAIGELERGIEDLNHALRIDPDNAQALHIRSLLIGIKDPILPPKINGLTEAEWFEKGMHSTEPDTAIICYSFVIELNPKFTDAYYNRGNAYHDMGDIDNAIADYSRALLINPNYIYPYASRGIAYARRGDYYQAIVDFNHALQIDSNYVEAYFGRAVTYKAKGDIYNARRDFQRAADLGLEDAKRSLKEMDK